MAIHYNNGIEEEKFRMTLVGYSGSSSDNVLYLNSQRNQNSYTGSKVVKNDNNYTAFADVPIAINNTKPIGMFSNTIANKNKNINGSYYSDTYAKSQESIKKSNYGPSVIISENITYNNGRNTNYIPYIPPGSIADSNNSTADTTNGGGWYCIYGVECDPAYTIYSDSSLASIGFCASNGPYATQTEASENCEYQPPPPDIDTLPVSPNANEKVSGFYYTAVITKITNLSETISNVVYGNQNYSNIGGNSKLVVSTSKYLEPGSYIRDISSIGYTNIYGEFILGEQNNRRLYYCFDTNKLTGSTYGTHRCLNANVYTQGYDWGWNEDIRNIVGGPFLDASGCAGCIPPEPYDVGDPVDFTITDDELNEHYKSGYAADFPVLEDGVYIVQLLNRDTYPLGTPAPLLPWTMPNKRPDNTWPQGRPFAIAVSDGIVRFRPSLDVSVIGTQKYSWYGNYTEESDDTAYLGPTKNGSCFTTTETEMTLAQAIILEATYENSWQNYTWTNEDERYLGSGGIYADTRATNGIIIHHLYKILNYQDHYIEFDSYGNFNGGGTFSFDEFLQTYGICDRFSLSILSDSDRIPLCSRKWTKDIEYYHPDLETITTKLRECNWCGYYNPSEGTQGKTFIKEIFYETDFEGNEFAAGWNLKPCWPTPFKDSGSCAVWVDKNKIGYGPAPNYKPIVDPNIEPKCQCE